MLNVYPIIYQFLCNSKAQLTISPFATLTRLLILQELITFNCFFKLWSQDQ
jgi:hypothetical protein